MKDEASSLMTPIPRQAPASAPKTPEPSERSQLLPLTQLFRKKGPAPTGGKTPSGKPPKPATDPAARFKKVKDPESMLQTIRRVTSGSDDLPVTWIVAAAAVLGAAAIAVVMMITRSGEAPKGARPVGSAFTSEQTKEEPSVRLPVQPLEPPQEIPQKPQETPPPQPQAITDPTPKPTPSTQAAKAPLMPVAAAVQAPLVRRPAATPGAESWVFSGRLYDLMNLRPVYEATLMFRDSRGKAGGKVITGDDGGYRLSLPALESGGYWLTIEHPDYLDKYIEEVEPPLHTMPRDQRRNLSTLNPKLNPIEGSPYGATRKDLILVPKVMPLD